MLYMLPERVKVNRSPITQGQRLEQPHEAEPSTSVNAPRPDEWLNASGGLVAGDQLHSREALALTVTVSPNTPYATSGLLGGRLHSFFIRVSDEVANHQNARGFQLDLFTAEWVGPAGQREPVFAPREGEPPRPPLTSRWARYWPECGVWALPKKELTIGTDAAYSVVTPHRVFDDKLQYQVPRPVPVPLKPLPNPLEQVELAPGVTLHCEPKTRAAAARAFDEVLGKRARAPRGTAAIERRLAELNRLAKGPEAGQRLDDWRVAACAATGMPVDLHHGFGENDKPKLDESLRGWCEGSAIAERSKLMPVEVVVIPKGHHLADAPGLPPEAIEHLRSDTRIAACIVPLEDKFVVLTTEADVLGSQQDIRHELVHVLERKYLSKDEQMTVVGEFIRSQDDDGVFASHYGCQAHEFLTTMSELFEGHAGPAGIEFLKREQPTIYSLLSDATGRSP